MFGQQRTPRQKINSRSDLVQHYTDKALEFQLIKGLKVTRKR